LVSGSPGRQQLQCDLAGKRRVTRQINLSHPCASQRRDDSVPTYRPAFSKLRSRILDQVGGGLIGRRFDETRLLLISGDQGFDFGSEIRIRDLRLDERDLPVAAFLQASSLKSTASKPRLCKCPIPRDRGMGYAQHRRRFFDCQAAKKRSSTMRAWSGFVAARSCNASSRATRSTPDPLAKRSTWLSDNLNP
jgi:hypothetical protein